MPPKKATRKSLPEGINGGTLNHSRRSPRVTSPRFTTTKEVNDSSPRSLKTPASSGDIRFYYNPQTPPSSKSLPSSSPELPSTRRRVFQARPSRLSNVYTPVVETPKSTQSRRTRRMTTLESIQKKTSSNETPEGLASTGWTFDQYMGGIDDKMDPTSPSVASSKATRSSARLRKPTTRALESLQTETRTGRKKTTPAPAPSQDETTQSIAPAPTTAAPKAAKPTPLTKSTKPAKAISKGKKGKKPTKVVSGTDVSLGINISVNDAGRQLWEAALHAFSKNFSLHEEDPLKEYVKARAVFYQRLDLVGTTFEGCTKTSSPEMCSDGWVQSGYTNFKGEAIIIAPSEENPYWFPKTYLDENLPFPPVRSRTESQARGDATLGFPPRMGDRNIPEVQPQFLAEDVSEERARAAQAQAGQVASAPAPTPAANPPAASTRARGKRRRSASAPASEIGPAQADEEEDSLTTKRRRRNARTSLPGPVTATLSSPSKDAPAQGGTSVADDGEGVTHTFPRLKLTQPKPEAQSTAVEQSPGAAKGKKRGASSLGPEAESSGAKRTRAAPGIDSEASEPRSRKRASSTKKGKQRP